MARQKAEHKHIMDNGDITGPHFSGVQDGDPYTGQLGFWRQHCRDSECVHSETVGVGIVTHYPLNAGRYSTKHGDFVFPTGTFQGGRAA